MERMPREQGCFVLLVDSLRSHRGPLQPPGHHNTHRHKDTEAEAGVLWLVAGVKELVSVQSFSRVKQCNMEKIWHQADLSLNPRSAAGELGNL